MAAIRNQVFTAPVKRLYHIKAVSTAAGAVKQPVIIAAAYNCRALVVRLNPRCDNTDDPLVPVVLRQDYGALRFRQKRLQNLRRFVINLLFNGAPLLVGTVQGGRNGGGLRFTIRHQQFQSAETGIQPSGGIQARSQLKGDFMGGDTAEVKMRHMRQFGDADPVVFDHVLEAQGGNDPVFRQQWHDI
ncbi:MAG: hypothetical protein BWX68_03076 [Verrucomicrobia bacterium ADurb.Bin063]|nr:MAG: hypothetical protein BWX68_03076 [Verrucomicrobia bacterium ADurb.Bin063]